MILPSINKCQLLGLCFFCLSLSLKGQTYVGIGLENALFFEIGQPGDFQPSYTPGVSAELSFRGRVAYISYSSPRLNRTFDEFTYELKTPIIHYGIGRNYQLSKANMLLGYMVYFGNAKQGKLYRNQAQRRQSVYSNYYTFGLGINYHYSYSQWITLGCNGRFEFSSWDLHQGSFDNPHPGIYRMFSLRAFAKFILPFKVNNKE